MTVDARLKLTLFISSLEAGGAERVLSQLANGLAQRGHDITLVHLGEGHAPFYPLDDRIRVIATGLAGHSRSPFHALAAMVRRLRRLRSCFIASAPDVILSFMERNNVVALLAAAGTGIPVVISERSDPSRNPLPWPWRWLRRRTYPFCARLVVQHEGIRAFFTGRVARKTAVLPNPLREMAGLPARPPRGEAAGTVLAMGRLGPEKRFDLLLEAFALTRAAFPGWRLAVLGEGPQRPALEALAGRLGLAPSVDWAGQVRDPENRLGTADLFVLSSQFEGFPNALGEAMACGLPVISTDCSPVIRDLVSPGQNGLVVPTDDAPALAGAMAALMADGALRERMGLQARDRVRRYQGGAVIEAWEALLSAARKGAAQGALKPVQH